MSKLVVGSATDIGLVRSNNQDQFLVVPGLYAVADGMGGHAAGEVASSTAVQALAAAFQRGGQRSVAALEGAAKTANRAVWEQARTNRHMLGMGTTLVVLAVVERTDGTNGLAIAHIGDSRAYQLRAGAIRQLTVDHSLVQELVDDGQITQAQAAVHPQRHVLTRALGVEPDVVVDLLHVEAEHGDRYLLCSDGLPREASDEQIAAVLERFADPNEAAKELVALAKSRGGNDNITVVVVDVVASEHGDGPSIEVPSHPSSTASGLLEPGAGPDVPTSVVAPALAPAHPPDRVEPYTTEARGRKAAPEPATDATALGTGPTARGRSRTGLLEAPAAGAPSPTGGSDTRIQRIPAPRARPASPGAHVAAPRPRWVTWRVAAFVLAVCAVLGAAVGGLAWYARSTYYVQLDHGRIAIFQGRPGGVLWFQPTLVQRTRYSKSSVQSRWVSDLEAGVMEPSVPAAHSYVNRLVAEQAPYSTTPHKTKPHKTKPHKTKVRTGTSGSTTPATEAGAPGSQPTVPKAVPTTVPKAVPTTGPSTGPRTSPNSTAVPRST